MFTEHCSVRKVKTSVENVVQRSEEGLSDGTGGNKHFTQLIMNSRRIRREFQFLLQILKSRVSKQDGERHEHMNFTYYFGRSTCWVLSWFNSRGPACIYLGAVQVQSWVGRRLSRSVIGKSRRRAPIIPWDNDSLAQLTINRSLRSSTNKPCWTNKFETLLLHPLSNAYGSMEARLWNKLCCNLLYFMNTKEYQTARYK